MTIVRRMAACAGTARGSVAALARLARQRIVGAVVEAADAVAVDPFLIDLEDRAEQENRRHFFDRVADRLGGRRETPVSGRAVALLASTGKQLGRGIVIEAPHCPFYHIRPGIARPASAPLPKFVSHSGTPLTRTSEAKGH